MAEAHVVGIVPEALVKVVRAHVKDLRGCLPTLQHYGMKGTEREVQKAVTELENAVNDLPTYTPERLLEIARSTGLREAMHGVPPAAARELLAEFVRALAEGCEDGKSGTPPAPRAPMMRLPVRDTITRT